MTLITQIVKLLLRKSKINYWNFGFILQTKIFIG